MARVGLISLGCPKNRVDAEEILGEATRAGHQIETDSENAEVLIVNTCGFIRSAKEESIEAILDAVRCKTNGACRSVIVTGCLAQRYGRELAAEMPEVDAFVAPGHAREMDGIIARTLGGESVVEVETPGAWWVERRSRLLSTPSWMAYLRVADGCDNRCSYCAIPSIRGGFRSRDESDILEEARGLAELGVAELNIVGQDITRYGLDTHGELRLARLLGRLSELDGLHWIRLLYCYPTRVTDELIRVVGENEKVCKYLDIPLQHCSENVLSAMGRQGNRNEYLRLFEKIREACPDVALRTTVIVGFPGETEDDFAQLLDFVGKVRFDRLGAFVYSREEGTPAASYPNQVPRRTAERRLREIMSLQQQVSLERNQALIGRRLDTLVEEVDGRTGAGRSYRDAPEIDGTVYLEDLCAEPGDVISAKVVSAGHYDLVARPQG